MRNEILKKKVILKAITSGTCIVFYSKIIIKLVQFFYITMV